MTDLQAPEVSLRPQKENVQVGDAVVAFPGKGTGARYVWDLCMHAADIGESSTYVVETAAANTSMSKPSINSQITYFRKATGIELSRRVNTAKAEEKAAKAAEREAKKAERLQAQAGKREELIAKLEKRIEADTAKLAELRAAPAPADEEDSDAGYETDSDSGSAE